MTEHGFIIIPCIDEYTSKMYDPISKFYYRGEGREQFFLLYRAFKNELRKNIQQGKFIDSDWTEAIYCSMAEMYFETFEQYESNPANTPQSWRICFDTSIAKQNNLLQDALC